MARDLERDIEQLGHGLDELRTAIVALTRRYGEAAGDALADGRRQLTWMQQLLGTGADRVARGTRDGVHNLQGGVGERPLTSIAIAFAAGLVIGRLLRR